MDEVISKDQLRIHIENELTTNYSEQMIEENKKNIEKDIEQAVNSLTLFSENKYFSYLVSRQSSISIEQHIADLPDGIQNFEDWFNSGLLGFAKNMLSALSKNMNSNIHFSRLLDNQDYETFIIDSKTKDTNVEQWKSLLNPIFQISNTHYLAQASACINLSLDNAALSLLHLWVQSLWFEDKSIRKVFDDAKAIVAIRDNASKAGKKGAKKRHSLSENVKKHAITLYLNGNFNNPNQAIDSIYLVVIAYGKSINFLFSSDFQAQKTIYNWILPYKYKPTK